MGRPSHPTPLRCGPIVAPRSLSSRWCRSASRASSPQWGCSCRTWAAVPVQAGRCRGDAPVPHEDDLNMIWTNEWSVSRNSFVCVWGGADAIRQAWVITGISIFRLKEWKPKSIGNITFLFSVGWRKLARLFKCYLFYISYQARSRSRSRSRSGAQNRSRSRNSRTTNPHPCFVCTIATAGPCTYKQNWVCLNSFWFESTHLAKVLNGFNSLLNWLP